MGEKYGIGTLIYITGSVSFELPNHYLKLTALENLNFWRILSTALSECHGFTGHGRSRKCCGIKSKGLSPKA